MTVDDIENTDDAFTEVRPLERERKRALADARLISCDRCPYHRNENVHGRGERRGRSNRYKTERKGRRYECKRITS